jgi:hypothetical protein
MVMTRKRRVSELIESRKLDGICQEAIDVLSDKLVNPMAFGALRKMCPRRQIEVAEQMVRAGNWTGTYAQALLAATRQADLANPRRIKKVAGLKRIEIVTIERETSEVQEDFKRIEKCYGVDALLLVVTARYLARLIANPEIERFLENRYPTVLRDFQVICDRTS